MAAAKQSVSAFSAVIAISAILVSLARASTDPRDVAALQELYGALNNPPELKGWRGDGGDPCEESWDGVSCSGTSVIDLKLHGLNLYGYLNEELYNLFNLKHLDVSSNNIVGAIPYALPPNATHINLACNNLVENIPYSLPTSLEYLNLSRNLLSGPVGDAFTGLQHLRQLDLSYNKFTGDLPSSIGSLTNLTGLNLSHNMFSGPVGDVLTGLEKLRELDLSDNYFTGDIPNSFETSINLTELFRSSVILYHKVQDEHEQLQRPNHLPLILMVGAVVAFGALLFLSAQRPNNRKRKEPDNAEKKSDPPKKHEFLNPMIKQLPAAPFSAPAFEAKNYLVIDDMKPREGVNPATLIKKKDEGSSNKPVKLHYNETDENEE